MPPPMMLLTRTQEAVNHPIVTGDVFDVVLDLKGGFLALCA